MALLKVKYKITLVKAGTNEVVKKPVSRFKNISVPNPVILEDYNNPRTKMYKTVHCALMSRERDIHAAMASESAHYNKKYNSCALSFMVTDIVVIRL